MVVVRTVEEVTVVVESRWLAVDSTGLAGWVAQVVATVAAERRAVTGVEMVVMAAMEAKVTKVGASTARVA